MKYHGSCHCQNVRFSFEVPDLTEAVTCNCSHCSRKGFMLSFVPGSQISIQLDTPLSTYLFNKKHIQHQFCTICGVQCFGVGENPENKEMTYAVNLRTVENLNLEQLKLIFYDGKSL